MTRLSLACPLFTTGVENGNRWHTTEEVAPHLHLSIRGLRTHPERDDPALQVRRRCLFDLSEIDAWLNGAELETLLNARGGRVVGRE